MGKSSRNKKDVSRKVVDTRTPPATPNYPLLVVSAIGIILTGYLSWTAFNGEDVKGCAVGGGCDVVLSSRWATLLGMPTAFWGLMTYLTLAATALMRRAEQRWKWGWSVAMFGWIYSIYLTTVSLTVLKAACPYCLTSLTLITASFALCTFQRPSTMSGFSWIRMLKWTVPSALAVILVLHLNYSGVFGQTPTEEDPVIRALASYMKDQGVKFYGASWCPHCQEQKSYFGLSAKRLPYIECSPNGQGTPQATECAQANIVNYPTWVIKGQRFEEVMSIDLLKQRTGFQQPK